MNARALNVLHDTRNEDILAVADSVDLDFGTLEIFIDKNRVFNVLSEDDRHVFLNVSLVEGDDHVLTAENVGRTEKNGIADCIGNIERFLCRHNGNAARTLDVVLLKQLVKALSVLSHVDSVVGGAEDIYIVLAEELGQFDSCLSAEGDNNAVGILGLDDTHNILCGQRLKVKSVCGVKVGGYGLGVVVYDNNVEARLLERPYAVYGSVVELDALTDTDRT